MPPNLLELPPRNDDDAATIIDLRACTLQLCFRDKDINQDRTLRCTKHKNENENETRIGFGFGFGFWGCRSLRRIRESENE